MLPNDFFNRLTQQITERLKNVGQAPEEIQKAVQGVVKGAVNRLDLVSREDFDILMDVLTRTRERVESLEKKVEALEAKVGISSEAMDSKTRVVPLISQNEQDKPATDSKQEE